MLGFPLALFIARSGARKNLYLSLVILPFWTSFLIRTYAWMFLLRDTGLINTHLQALHIIHEPLPMLYNNGAVILGLVYGFLPFTVLPLYATLERLDPNLLEAAADLGANPWDTLWRVTIPLCAPGIRAARDPGVRAVPGNLSHVGLAGRQQDHSDRQSGAEPIHRGARLAVRRGGFDRADADRDRASVFSAAKRRGDAVRKHGLAFYAILIYAFLHVPLLILAVFSFNSSKFTVWQGFSLHWYRPRLPIAI